MIANITINKIISQSPELQNTLLDLTNDTVNKNNLTEGETAHDKEGEPVFGVFNIEDSEAWAVGTRNGEPVQEGDLNYHNNSLWYSQVSEDASEVSKQCMEVSGEHAEDSEGYAIGRRGGILVKEDDPTYHNNSLFYSEISAQKSIESAESAELSRQYSIASDESMVACGSILNIAGEKVEDAEAWAVGTRSGVPVIPSDPTYNNSSEYWAGQARLYAQGGLIYQGSITSSDIPISGMHIGDMYNMENDFITDSRFQEGEGHKVKAGNNIAWNPNDKWDVLGLGGGGDDDNFVGTLEQWNELTAEQKNQYKTADIIDDFNGVPIDDALSSTSEHPVQNKVVTAALEEMKPYTTTVSILSLPYTLVNENITEDMKVTGAVLSNPAAMGGNEWTWTIPDGGGSIVITGTLVTGQTTDLTMHIEKVRTLE